MKNTYTLIIVVLSVFTSLYSQSVAINWDNSSGDFPLKNQTNSVFLSKGVDTLNGDGSLIQLGYYSTASASNNFSGVWTPLTLTTTIGDSGNQLGGAPAGIFSFSTTFSLSSPTTSMTYLTETGQITNTISNFTSIASGQVLAIRFYNGNTIAGSTFYGAVSSDSWTWVAPSNNSWTLSLNPSTTTSGLEWENGKVGYTGIAMAIPEPKDWFLFLISLGFLLVIKKRNSVNGMDSISGKRLSQK